MRVLELFCGIGGAAAALGGARATIVEAVDISELALGVYRHNFDHPTRVGTIESLPPDRLAATNANLWWLSPPCQPYTARGLRRDVDDPRARSLLHLIDCLDEVRPTAIGLENVPGFAGSRAHQRLRGSLSRGGYEVVEMLLCPTELGYPMRRRRFYLVASRARLAPVDRSEPDERRRPLGTFLRQADSRLDVSAELAARYANAIDVVDANEPDSITACFTSAYGRSPVRSGSYLRVDDHLRRFSPREILGLLGFPDDYRLPAELDRSRGWRLVGNSVAVPCVRRALSAIPELRPSGQASL